MTNTAESLAVSLIDKTTSEAKDQLNNYFDKVKGNLIATKQLCDQGIFDAVEITNINAYLLPVFNTYPEINTIVVANPLGTEYSIIRKDSTWLSNVVFESADSGMIINRELWKGNIFDKEIIREWTDYNAQYDPRTRPWFIGAMGNEYPDEPWWTEPYVFFTDQVPGITVSMRSFCPISNDTNVIQYDILLSNISEFTIKEKVSEHSKTFVMTQDLKVIGLPSETKFNDPDSIPKYVLSDYDSIGSHVLELSVNKWKDFEDNYSDAFSLEIDDETWWVKISPFELGKNRLFLIGVAVPENDFLSEVNSTRNVVIGGFLIVMIIIIIVVRQYIVKRKMNLLLARQKEQISTQRDEIHKQHEIVVEQKQEITDSINYAKKIQEAMLPAVENLGKILAEHFLLFKPKDIVSGDFFWATETNEWVIVTAADCTGHGVPGAFMSMLGVSFLNEIVRKKEVASAASVLNHLRTSVIEALKQTGKEGTQKDGMDMSIIAIHKDRQRASWAGANNPLYIIRPKTQDPNSKSKEAVCNSAPWDLDLGALSLEFTEIKGDNMPVAVHVKMDDFTNHEIELETGDKLYLFTDGFPDQFGGPKGKKFMYKKFKRIIAETSDLPMPDQGKELEKIFEEWISWDPEGSGTGGEKHEQVDDITIIGFKI